MSGCALSPNSDPELKLMKKKMIRLTESGIIHYFANGKLPRTIVGNDINIDKFISTKAELGSVPEAKVPKVPKVLEKTPADADCY